MKLFLHSLLIVGSLFAAGGALADSVNSPNITLNVDTNRTGGAGAGNVSIAINTITLAETTLPEYSSTAGKKITIAVRPGFQFDPTSNVSATSVTVGLNGAAANTAAVLTPAGTANEVLTFNFTSGTNTAIQDIVRINGIRIRILDAVGAAGPAQTTMQITTTTAGGAFTNQGIVAANISKGLPDHLVFSVQPSSIAAGDDLLPSVQVADFGGNLVTTATPTISLALQTNPGSATLLGTTSIAATSGVATWADADNLRITTSANGYSLRASHNGTPFLTSDTVDSQLFDISASVPGGLVFTTQPVETAAGDDLLIAVTAVDSFSNPITGSSIPVTLGLTTGAGDAALLTDSSLTKSTSSGIASWGASDSLRITVAGEGYRITASGLGAPAQSNLFNIVPAEDNSVRFIQQPSNVRPTISMVPPVITEIIDAFGNRTFTTAAVKLTSLNPICTGELINNTEISTDGVATFDRFRIDRSCRGDFLKAASPGLGWGQSDTYTITGAKAVPTSAKDLQIKPNRLLSLKTTAQLKLPTSSTDKPTARGGSIVVTGATGSFTVPLARNGWKAKSGGFEFKSNKCSKITVKKSGIQLTCKPSTGAFALPESGPVSLVLNLGNRGFQFCVSCGGTSSGDQSSAFRRINCSAPAACP